MAKIPHPEPGIYALVRDVHNPAGDWRVKYGWRRTVFKDGEQYVVEAGDDIYSGAVIRRAGQLSESLAFSEANRSTLQLVTENMERVAEDSLETILLYARENLRRVNPDEILRQLVDAGEISLLQVQGAINRARGEK